MVDSVRVLKIAKAHSNPGLSKAAFWEFAFFTYALFEAALFKPGFFTFALFKSEHLKPVIPRRRNLSTWLGLAVLCGTQAVAALAQSPVEERQIRPDAYSAAQQRVEFARKSSEAAEADVRRLDGDFQEADNAMQAAQKQLEASRARRDKARQSLAQAAKRSAEAKRGLEREEQAFEQLRKAGAIQTQGNKKPEAKRPAAHT
jgi:hypothetical protein